MKPQRLGNVSIPDEELIKDKKECKKMLDSRIQAVGKTKHYIQDMMTNGMHFPIDDMPNEELL